MRWRDGSAESPEEARSRLYKVAYDKKREPGQHKMKRGQMANEAIENV